MITKTSSKELDLSSLVATIYFRAGVFVILLISLFYHFQNFYASIWTSSPISANFFAFAHIALSVYLMLKNGAWSDILASGAITAYVIALTFVLHSRLINLDVLIGLGWGIWACKALIISIVVSGLVGISTSFTR